MALAPLPFLDRLCAASAITRRRHLVIDPHRTDLGVTRQGCHHIHEMIVTRNRTCVLLAMKIHEFARLALSIVLARSLILSLRSRKGEAMATASLLVREPPRLAGALRAQQSGGTFLDLPHLMAIRPAACVKARVGRPKGTGGDCFSWSR